jgi:hypothetical protein
LLTIHTRTLFGGSGRRRISAKEVIPMPRRKPPPPGK